MGTTTPIRPKDPNPSQKSKRMYNQATRIATMLATKSYARTPRVLRFQTSRNARSELRTITVFNTTQLTTKYREEIMKNKPKSL